MQLEPDFLRRLVQGAPWLWIDTRMRAAAAAIAVLAVFCGVALFEASEPWRRLADAEPKADAAPETRLLAALAWVEASRIDTVILLGGSTARELTSSEARVSGLLTERCGRPIRFINGSTSSQTIAETWIIAEAVPDDLRVLTVVGMNYLRFEESPAEVARDVRPPLLPLGRSASLERALADAGHPPASTLPGLTGTAWLLPRLDQVDFRSAPEPFDDFLARRNDEAPWEGPLNLYRNPPLDPASKTAITHQRIAERLSLFEARHAGAGSLWRAFLDRFDGPRSNVLFLALPEDPSMTPFTDLAGDAFAAEMAGLGHTGAHVADWRKNHGLAQGDFYDQQHLLGSGRRKIEPRLLDLLAGSLDDCRRRPT